MWRADGSRLLHKATIWNLDEIKSRNRCCDQRSLELLGVRDRERLALGRDE